MFHHETVSQQSVHMSARSARTALCLIGAIHFSDDSIFKHLEKNGLCERDFSIFSLGEKKRLAERGSGTRHYVYDNLFTCEEAFIVSQMAPGLRSMF